MTTSVVIPVFNGLEYLKKNLPAVVALGADQIVIVDDASTDASSDFVKGNYPDITLLVQNKNQRFPKTVNAGFLKATGEVVILLNQDVKPYRDLLKNALKHFTDPQVFAITFNEQGRSWATGGWKNGMLEFSNGVLDDHEHNSLWASGGSAAFRKNIWDSLGGFDPIFTPGYYEDLDLGLRAHAAGYTIIWDPKCKVDHVTESTFPKAFEKKELIRIKERNLLLTVWKNIPNNQKSSHLVYLIKRTTLHPGYLVPILMAIYRLICY